MNRLKAEDFKDYQFVSNPVFSTNGNHFAFQVASVEDGDGYQKNIWISKNLGGSFPLTKGKKDQFVLWEDDRTILFSSPRDKESSETTDFYRISTEGGEANKVFSIPLEVSSIKKIGQGKYAILAKVDMDQAAFEGTRPEEDPWNADIQVIEELPFWENGEGFTANMRTKLFLFDENCQEELIPISEKEVAIREVYYDEKGEALYYIGKDFHRIAQCQNSLYKYNLLNQETTVFLENQFEIQELGFYKEKIIFVGSDMKTHGLNENTKLFSFCTASGELELLAEPDLEIGSSVGTDSSLGGGQGFKIGGENLYFTAPMDYSGYLHQFSLETKECILLTDQGDSVTAFDVHEETGNMILTMFSEGNLAEIYGKRKGEKNWKKYTHLNTEFHQQHSKSSFEHHTFMDAEGFEIDGWAMKPVGYEKGKTYPAILHIHGGPKSLFGEIYHHEMQLWANNGYFVLFCNPRGSDGKGDLFADIRGKYGTVDYENILQFLDQMLLHYPEIDATRLGVTGGSYGGFMTNWMIGHTHRFKAAATQRSISNWVSKSYMSDIGYYFNVDQVLAENWETSSFDVERLWEASPLKYIHTAKTPTLIVHSDQDYRCTIPEGYQLFSALQLAGVETKMCVFHGENHELSRSGKPKNRLRRLNEILNWMNKYLQEK